MEGFPDEVIKYVCDPRTGLQRRMKWPPTISEVVDACEEHEQHLKRVRTARPLQQLSKPYDRPSPNLGKIFVANDHPGYARLVGGSFQPYAVDGRNGLMVPPEILVDLGMMKRSAL